MKENQNVRIGWFEVIRSLKVISNITVRYSANTILYRFWDIASYFLKQARFSNPKCIWRLSDDHIAFTEILYSEHQDVWPQKTEVSSYCVALFA